MPEPWQLMQTTVPVPSQLGHVSVLPFTVTVPLPKQLPQMICPVPEQYEHFRRSLTSSRLTKVAMTEPTTPTVPPMKPAMALSEKMTAPSSVI